MCAAPTRGMRTLVHEDRAIERAHELDVVGRDLARERILLLEDACAAKASPLVWRRMRTALVLRRAPDRFGGRIGAHPAGIVERNPEVVTEGGCAVVSSS